jgi:spermidine synthase
VTSVAAMENRPKPYHKALFLLTICMGSLLLFLVQPMIARMALPRLGGAPAVWNSAMLVYQTLLLAGYAYAHMIGRLAPRKQAMLHLALFALAAIMLPIGLSDANPPADGSPYFWVPWLLLSSIGPLFFVVAAQAPLMQRWYSVSGGGDPYPLYSASNLGSFGGLIAYPLLVEPTFQVTEQSWVWTAGYALLALLVLICSLQLRPSSPAAGWTQTAPTTPAPGWRVIGKWILLAAIPSGLMLSTSLHLTTDIVAMPLMWVLPLGLYLLSFSIAFAENRTLADMLTRIAPFFVLFAACATFVDATAYPFVIAALILSSLFVISVALHARMFDLRPEVDHLTRFYLAMSFGGMLGGLFCALVAPLIFDWTYEHPILLVLASVLIAHKPIFGFMERFWANREQSARATRWGLIALLFISIAAIGPMGDATGLPITLIAGVALVSVAALTFGHSILFPALVCATLLSINGWDRVAMSMRAGDMTRSFFGVYSIGTRNDEVKLLIHGTTVHGTQVIVPGKEKTPTTYYAPKGGVGLAMQAAPKLFGNDATIGVVGLGAGTLSCYAQPGQSWRYYEIDPVIVDLARDPKKFTFLSRCNPDVPVAIGDARLVLAAEPKGQTDLLVIDAFSSDSVPMHLLTKEAFATYRANLTSQGLLMVHISNRYLDLRPVLAAAASDGWTTAIRNYTASDEDRKSQASSSVWVALSPDARTIQRLKAETGPNNWGALVARPGFEPWTDNYGSILPLLMIGK